MPTDVNDSNTSYQTLDEFMENPFHQRASSQSVALIKEKTALEAKYNSCSRDIYFVASAERSESFLLHIKIPSKSKPGSFYDVVLQFFTDDSDAKYGDDLSPYMLRFFSNSPSFVYKYSALYAEKSYLISSLQSKLNAESITRYPEKTNAGGTLMYDKSIYLACRYIQENRLSLLSKRRLLRMRRVTVEELFRGVSHLDSIRLKKDDDIISGISRGKIEKKSSSRSGVSKNDESSFQSSLGKVPKSNKIAKSRRAASTSTSGVSRKRPAVRPKISPTRGRRGKNP